MLSAMRAAILIIVSMVLFVARPAHDAGSQCWVLVRECDAQQSTSAGLPGGGTVLTGQIVSIEDRSSAIAIAAPGYNTDLSNAEYLYTCLLFGDFKTPGHPTKWLKIIPND